MSESTPRWSIAPYFVVEDVVATAEYYRDRLGFRYDRLWGDPPTFCMVYRRGVVIMLSQLAGTDVVRPNKLVEEGAWDAYVWVDDADALHEELRSAGVTIERAICDQEYGCRDFTIEDCNGYLICFGHLTDR